MKVYVHLNDIFDLTRPTVTEQRLEYAFGTDGTDFWGKFFPCDERHRDNKIVYLFTEYQLKFIWDWLDNKNKTGNDDIKKNLDYSRLKLFCGLKLSPDGRYTDRIRVCFAKFGPNHGYLLKRLYFGLPPYREKINIDFFDGRFAGKPPDATSEERRRNELLKLAGMRRQIEKEFGGPGKFDTKWLRYLGPQYTNLPVIEYCATLDTGCPLTKKR